MPTAAPRACACGAVVQAGRRCVTCASVYDRRRGNSTTRGYGTDWRKLRATVPPTPCVDCGAAWTPGHNLDHHIPRSRGGTDDKSNLRWRCHGCHSVKTATKDRPSMNREKPDRMRGGPSGGPARNLAGRNRGAFG